MTIGVVVLVFVTNQTNRISKIPLANENTKNPEVCMYDVVVAAAVVVNIVIVLLLGGSSRRVCVVGRVGRRVCGCGWVCGWVGGSERKDREEKK